MNKYNVYYQSAERDSMLIVKQTFAKSHKHAIKKVSQRDVHLGSEDNFNAYTALESENYLKCYWLWGKDA